MADYDDFNLAYEKEGKPISVWEWGRLKELKDYYRVAQHWVKGWHLSTVWIGIDHAFGDGTPLIFETMIFAPTDADYGGDNPLHRHYAGYCERYTSEAAALAGHDRLLEELRDALSASLRDVLTFADLSAYAESARAPDDLSALAMHDDDERGDDT